MTSVGFTGTSTGLTNAQTIRVHQILGDLKSHGVIEGHHGMCIGGDDGFHTMAQAFHYRLVGHPGVTSTGQAWKRARCVCDEVLPAKFFLERNKDIVIATHLMIAAPAEVQMQRRGGTWQTVRYCREQHRPLVLVYPDGNLGLEQLSKIPLSMVQSIAAIQREVMNHGRLVTP